MRKKRWFREISLRTLPDGKKCFAPLPRTVYLVLDNRIMIIPAFGGGAKGQTTKGDDAKSQAYYPQSLQSLKNSAKHNNILET